MSSPTPTPSHYTLLLKSQRTTVLLSLLPSDTLSYLKEQLFNALTGSSPEHIASPLPTTPSSLILGFPRYPADWSRGWYPIGEDADMEVIDLVNDDLNNDDARMYDEEEEALSKAKSKGNTNGKGKGKATKTEWTVERAGLKDGCVVGYYVKIAGGRGDNGGFVVERPVDDYYESSEEEKEEKEKTEEDEIWDYIRERAAGRVD